MRLSGHTAAIDRCAVAPDGTQLATICVDGTVRLWDTTTGSLRILLNGQDDTTCCAVGPRGTWLATDGRDGDHSVVRLWDIATGGLADQWSFYGQLSGLVPAPDGTWLAAPGTHTTQRGATLLAWTIRREADGKLYFDHGLMRDGATSFAAAPDGRWVAVKGYPDRLEMWDTTTWRCVTVTWLDNAIIHCEWPSDSPGPSVTTAGTNEPTVFDFNR